MDAAAADMFPRSPFPIRARSASCHKHAWAARSITKIEGLSLATSDSDPDAAYTAWIRSQVESAREYRRAEQRLHAQES